MRKTMLDCELTPILRSVVFEDFVSIFKRDGNLIDSRQWEEGISPSRAEVQNLQLGQKVIVRLLFRLLHQYVVEEQLDGRS
jgi:hypothetical protein